MTEAPSLSQLSAAFRDAVDRHSKGLAAKGEVEEARAAVQDYYDRHPVDPGVAARR